MDDKDDLFDSIDKEAAAAEPTRQTLRDRIEDDADVFERLGSKIPGLRGIVDRGRLREADQLLRETISSRLEETRLQLGNVYQELSRDIILAIDYAESLGRVDTRLAGLISKIKDAPLGYAGLFDALKVDSEELSQIYDFDERLFDHADLIGSSVAALEKAVRDSGNVEMAMRGLERVVRDGNTAYEERRELLSGFQNPRDDAGF